MHRFDYVLLPVSYLVSQFTGLNVSNIAMFKVSLHLTQSHLVVYFIRIFELFSNHQ